jgi:hypothetical protein
VGASNWHLQAQAIERIEEARAQNIDVEFDCDAYIAGSSVLKCCRKTRLIAA